MRDLAARIARKIVRPRNPAPKAEEAVLGGSGNNRMRRFAAGDSTPITHAEMKVYLLRVSTLVARGADKFELGWKSPRGSVDSRGSRKARRFSPKWPSPGTAFEGSWQERSAGDRGETVPGL